MPFLFSLCLVIVFKISSFESLKMVSNNLANKRFSFEVMKSKFLYKCKKMYCCNNSAYDVQPQVESYEMLLVIIFDH
jgi:hypothetical protein